MSYTDQANLSRDQDFNLRLAACAVKEVSLNGTTPLDWAWAHQWEVAASPGFSDAYGSAVLNEVEKPGEDPSVISDNQILSAVQALYPQS